MIPWRYYMTQKLTARTTQTFSREKVSREDAIGSFG